MDRLSLIWSRLALAVLVCFTGTTALAFRAPLIGVATKLGNEVTEVPAFVDDQTNNTAGLFYMGVTNDTLVDWSSAGNHGNLFLGTGAEATYNVATNGTNATYTFVSAPDAIGFDDMLADISTATIGTFAVWAKVASDNGAQNGILIGLPSSGSTSQFVLEFDMRARDNVRAMIVQDGTTLWEQRTTNNFMDNQIGKWVHVVLNQPGTGLELYINGLLITNPPTTSTDPTAFVKTVAVDATTDIATMDLGLFGGSLNAAGFNGELYLPTWYTTNQTPAHIFDLFLFTSAVQGPGSQIIPTTLP